jgi:1-acyl-sn-glycerol-3-phosphate acyltransferase
MALRSLVFLIYLAVMTPPVSLILLVGFLLPRLPRYRLITQWSRLVVGGARLIVGIRGELIGAEHLSPLPHVVLCKHSSTWETVFLQLVLPPMAFVAKRELVWIPFFGWGFALFSPILIDRGKASEAMQQIIQQGRERIAQGFWITLFPEGTRVEAGKRGRYKPGGARLAIELGVPILPIAHNAGYCWPRSGWKKFAGRVTVSIGPAIETQGRRSEEVMKDVERWIEQETARLGDPRGLA